jgi:hypothetical protein
MLNIITPQATDVTATQEGDYVTISFNGQSLTLPAIARPANVADIIYLGDTGALQYVPGNPVQMVAVLACGTDPMSLTLCPLLVSPVVPVEPV